MNVQIREYISSNEVTNVVTIANALRAGLDSVGFKGLDLDVADEHFVRQIRGSSLDYVIIRAPENFNIPLDFWLAADLATVTKAGRVFLLRY